MAVRQYMSDYFLWQSFKFYIRLKSRQDTKGEATSSPSKKPAAGELKTFRGLVSGIYQIGVSSTCTYSSIPGWPTGGNAGWFTGRPNMLKHKDKAKPAKEDPRRRPSNPPTWRTRRRQLSRISLGLLFPYAGRLSL